MEKHKKRPLSSRIPAPDWPLLWHNLGRARQGFPAPYAVRGALMLAGAVSASLCGQGSALSLAIPGWLWLFLALLMALPLRALRPARFTAWFFFGYGCFALEHKERLLTRLPESAGRIEGQLQGALVSVPEFRGRRLCFNFEVETLIAPSAPAAWRPRHLRLCWYGEAPPELRAGSRWNFSVRLRPPRPSFNEGSSGDWLLMQGIDATGYVYQSERAILISSFSWSHSGQALRQFLSTRLDSALTGLGTADVLRALAIGDRSRLSQERRWILEATGTGHLLAISGLHIGLAALLGAGGASVLWWLLPGSRRHWQLPRMRWATGLLVAATYAWLSGWGVPAQRSLLMLASFAVPALVRRRSHPFDNYGRALVFVLLFDPLAPASAGFWLSFAAVAALLVIFGSRWRLGRRRQLEALALISVVLAPLSLKFFGGASLLSPLANALAIPWVSALVAPWAMLSSLVAAFSPALASTALIPVDLCLYLLLRALAALATVDWGQWSGAPPPLPLLIFAFAGSLGLVLAASWRWRLAALMLFLPPFLWQPEHPQTKEFTLHALDVGQALAVVIETRNHVVVFDTGSRWFGGDSGHSRLAPFLSARGRRSVDVLIISHSDSDHSGGARSLRRLVSIKRVLAASPPPEITAQDCRSGQSWNADGVDFTLLHPPAAKHQFSDNDGACVLLVRSPYGSALLPSDIERKGEEILLSSYPNLAVDVLVAPHHGSTTSSTANFVAATRPRFVIFSVGQLNRWNFPDAKVQDRYERAGAEILRTDRSGQISLFFEEKQLRVVRRRCVIAPRSPGCTEG